jgi:hypothetical protein
VDKVNKYDDIKIDEWLWLDHTTWKIKYHNLVVNPTENHQKHTKLSGSVDGSQGDLFVTGSGTTFTSDFLDGDYIIFDEKKMLIDYVGDDDTIFLTTTLCEDVNNVDYLKEENVL